MSLGSFLKKAAHTVGTIGKYAAPVLALTGVGAPLAAGIGAASAGLSHIGQKGASLGSALKDAALTGGATYGIGKAAQGPGGIGGTLSRAAGWLGDEKAGAARMAGVTGILGAGAGFAGAQQAQGAQNEQAGYERQRQGASDLQRQAILDLFMKRFNGGAATPAAVGA